MRKIHSYLKADIQYPSFRLVPDPEKYPNLPAYKTEWVNNLTRYKKNAVPGIKYGLKDIDIDIDAGNRIRIFMGDKTVGMDYCIIGIIKLDTEFDSRILHVECFNYYESVVLPRWMTKFESDDDNYLETGKTGLQIFIDYIKQNYPTIRKIELTNKRGIYFNDTNSHYKYVNMSPTTLCLLTYNMDYYVGVEGFTYNNYMHHNENIILNTIAFFEYIKMYERDQSYIDIMQSILTKCEYIGLIEIQPIIYTLLKKGYYDWLAELVSYIGMENKVYSNYDIDYHIHLNLIPPEVDKKLM